MKELIEVLTWCRGAGTVSESLFVTEHIATVDGIWPDEYGNYHLTIGSKPEIMWSCHTDTVTRKEGRQNVRWMDSEKKWLGLHNPQNGQCLGADDGVGVYIMLELIKAKREGHYIFHRDEEIGGLGSSWIAKNSMILPSSLKCAIAMDRCGTEDIITHQMYSRTASNEFADSLAAMLPTGMRADDTGVFTDTANYVDVIGECTNLACGYERNHGPQEVLDTHHVAKLRDSILALDYSKLVYAREPGEYDVSAYYPSTKTYLNDDDEIWQNYIDGGDHSGSPLEHRGNQSMALDDMVKEAPDIAARLLDELGITGDEFRAHVFSLTGRLLGG